MSWIIFKTGIVIKLQVILKCNTVFYPFTTLLSLHVNLGKKHSINENILIITNSTTTRLISGYIYIYIHNFLSKQVHRDVCVCVCVCVKSQTYMNMWSSLLLNELILKTLTANRMQTSDLNIKNGKIFKNKI